MLDPVVQVIEEKTGNVIYTIRIKGNTFSLKVFAEGKYTIVVGNQKEKTKTISGIELSKEQETLEVVF